MEKERQGRVDSRLFSDLMHSEAWKMSESQYAKLPEGRALDYLIHENTYHAQWTNFLHFENVCPCIKGQLDTQTLTLQYILNKKPSKFNKKPSFLHKISKFSHFVRAWFAHLCLLNREKYIIFPALYFGFQLCTFVLCINHFIHFSYHFLLIIYVVFLILSIFETIFRFCSFCKIWSTNHLLYNVKKDFGFLFKLNLASFGVNLIIGLPAIYSSEDQKLLFLFFTLMMIFHKITHTIFYFKYVYYVLLSIPLTIFFFIIFYFCSFFYGLKDFYNIYCRERYEINVKPAIKSKEFRDPRIKCFGCGIEGGVFLRTKHCYHYFHEECMHDLIRKKNNRACKCKKSLYL